MNMKSSSVRKKNNLEPKTLGNAMHKLSYFEYE